MPEIQRRFERFNTFARVEAPDICQIHGSLADISKSGCKVRFPLSLTIDMDLDYTLKIKFTQMDKSLLFVLICHPQWLKEDDGSTLIGFEFLRSPDTARFNDYIQKLSDDEMDLKNDFIN